MGCENLVSLIIGDYVTHINDYAFEGCRNLTSLEIPNSIIYLSRKAFTECKLEPNIKSNLAYLGNKENPYLYLCGAMSSELVAAKIDENCKIIGEGAFSVCGTSMEQDSSGGYITTFESMLTSVEIPNSVISIGDYAFSGCSSLTSIEIPNSVISIGYGAFADCSSLEFNEYENCKYLGNAQNQYFALIEPIDEYLSSCTIRNSTKIICDGAFVGYYNLTSVVIGDSVTSIGETLFSGCYNLTNIEVGENNANYKAIDGNLYSKDGSVLIQYAIGKTTTAFTIPGFVTSIGSAAFWDCQGLTSVVIPNSVTSIGSYAFGYCQMLTSIKYCGSEAEWSAISKDNNWDYSTGNYTITYNWDGE